eukprot:jgi/Botrbrau1/18626/Bobra.0367s0063.1
MQSPAKDALKTLSSSSRDVYFVTQNRLQLSKGRLKQPAAGVAQYFLPHSFPQAACSWLTSFAAPRTLYTLELSNWSLHWCPPFWHSRD